MKIPGKCLCGAIQFMVTPKTLHTHICHCSMCRTWAGSLTMTVGLEGPPEFRSGEDLVTTYKASEWGERCFCKTCGTNLFQNAPGFNYFGVSAGVLTEEDQAKLSIDQEIFIDKKPAYYSFEGGQPKLTEAQFNAQFAGPDDGDKKGEEGK